MDARSGHASQGTRHEERIIARRTRSSIYLTVTWRPVASRIALTRKRWP